MNVLRNVAGCVRLDKSLRNYLFSTVELCNVGICAGTFLVPSAVNENLTILFMLAPPLRGAPTYGRPVRHDKTDPMLRRTAHGQNGRRLLHETA